MSTVGRELLARFETLGPEEQHEIATEILRRASTVGAMSEAALDELAGELFRAYDAEEAGGADSSAR